MPEQYEKYVVLSHVVWSHIPVQTALPEQVSPIESQVQFAYSLVQPDGVQAHSLNEPQDVVS